MPVYQLHNNFIFIDIYHFQGILVPLPAMIACLIDDDNYGYVQNDFPTTFCTSKDFKLWFYSYLLPVNIVLAVGSVLLFMIIGTIHKVKYKALYYMLDYT